MHKIYCFLYGLYATQLGGEWSKKCVRSTRRGGGVQKMKQVFGLFLYCVCLMTDGAYFGDHFYSLSKENLIFIDYFKLFIDFFKPFDNLYFFKFWTWFYVLQILKSIYTLSVEQLVDMMCCIFSIMHIQWIIVKCLFL
jgi:hypothetical protein